MLDVGCSSFFLAYDRPRVVHSPAGHDHAGHVRHSAVRPHQLSLSAGQRSAERGLSDDPVSASLPGASPETMASAVATPLEQQFSTIAGIDSMSSVSALGLTQITIQFSLERNIDAAAQDVQSAIAKASRQLPPGMPTPPTYNKVNPADQPILFLALTSDTLPLSTVDEYAQTLMAQRISMVNGVAQVSVFGAQTYAVRVQLDPNALASRGIGIDEVQDAIAQRQRQPADGHALRPAPGVHRPGQRPVDESRGLPAAHRRLSQRPAGAAAGTRPGHRQRAERQDRELVQRHARHRSRHPAPARRQHRGGGGQHPQVAADVPRADSRRR